MKEEEKLIGQDVIDFIKNNNLEKAIVTVTATIYRSGDHVCITTDKVSLIKDDNIIDFYVDDSLY